jgi:hypothetical protein
MKSVKNQVRNQVCDQAMDQILSGFSRKTIDI